VDTRHRNDSCAACPRSTLVDDAQIRAAQRLLASHAHTLAEGAGAAALAAVIARPGDFAGKRVAVICSGGNASAAEIAVRRDDAA
jgi:threonine dehydratase